MLSIRLDCPQTLTYFGEIFCPEFPVEVLLSNGVYQRIDFVLDSGADCTLVPRDMANLTGFRLPAAPDASVAGISGAPIPAYKGKIKIKIVNEELEVRCLYTESNNTPFLLGRVDVFSHFDVKFSGINSHIILDTIT